MGVTQVELPLMAVSGCLASQTSSCSAFMVCRSRDFIQLTGTLVLKVGGFACSSVDPAGTQFSWHFSQQTWAKMHSWQQLVLQ